jgi:glycosyltransferase involved in cell wall biosynthesis
MSREADSVIKYSIMIPVFNVREYLPKCIDSILNQDYSDEGYEIILVDDGSTDGSGDICDTYSEKYDNISVIHQENKGLLQARGTAVRRSKGEYIVFVDSDDYVEADLLSVVNGYIEKYAPDYLTYGFYIERPGKSIRCPITSEGQLIPDKMDLFAEFVTSDRYNSIWNKVVKGNILREHWEEIYSLRTNIGEDKLQSAYILKYSNKILMIGECLYHYVQRSTSIAHYKKEDDIHCIVQVYEKLDAVVRDILKSMGIATYMQERIFNGHRAQTLDSTLDHIFKLNKRVDMSDSDKCSSLERILSRNIGFFDGRKDVSGALRSYNKIRYRFLLWRKFRLLVRFDRFIQKILTLIPVNYI